VGGKALRDLERRYREDRAAVLDEPGVSWESKLKQVKRLYSHYREEHDALLRGAAGEGEEDGAA
jgi:hypothetical protein